MALKIALDANPETRQIAILLGPDLRQRRPRGTESAG
jgi:hypothetical protein